jgi:cytochrome c553
LNTIIPTLVNIILFATLSISSVSSAQTGEELYNTECAACHNYKISTIPNVYGQHKKYLQKSLIAFKQEGREDEIMFQAVENLTAQQIDDLASYLAGEDFCQGEVETTPLEGNPENGKILAENCTSCHGELGQGGIGPILSGQKTDYLVETIKKFRSMMRTNEPIMNNTTKNLSDEEISDLAAYFNSTRSCGN